MQTSVRLHLDMTIHHNISQSNNIIIIEATDDALFEYVERNHSSYKMSVSRYHDSPYPCIIIACDTL